MKKNRTSEVFVIQNSGGRSSAFMTETLLNDPKYQDSIITFQNTGKENNETLDFINQCDLRWQNVYHKSVIWLEYNPDLAAKFEIVNYQTAHRTGDKTKPSPFEKLIKKKSYLPNRVARFCTQELKVRVAKRYIMSLGFKYWTNCIGIRYDEPKRWDKVDTIQVKERFETLHPMVEWKTTKLDVDQFWQHMPFDLKLKSYEGNCDLCFLKGAGKKRQIIRESPEKVDWWIQMEKEKGATFRSEYSYQELVTGLKNAPEFSFRDDFECDIPCFCSID